MNDQPWQRVLRCNTPEAWLQAAAENVELLLVDHAHCERKAASTALAMMFRYPELADLQHMMSRLAREELRHYEQVLSLLSERGWKFRKLNPSGYAAGLFAEVRKSEPGRLLDALLTGALIEARSCERFAALAPYLESSLSRYYTRLCEAEARHFEQYLELAEHHDPQGELATRLAILSGKEAALVQSREDRFRFHSGVPMGKSTGLAAVG